MKKKYYVICSICIICLLSATACFTYRALPERYKSIIRPHLYYAKSYIEYKEVSSDKSTFSHLTSFKNKNVLAIGDSQTAMYKWQNYLGFMLGANVTTHAKGGIGMLTMIDGDKPLKSDNVDPNDFGVQHLLPLSADDVADKDYIIVMGLYNNNSTYAESRGALDDMYPADSTYCGQFNYMVKSIKNRLLQAGNIDCHVIVASPHIFGKYPYGEHDAYYYIKLGLVETLDSLCQRNNVDFCNLTKYAKIDSTNWDNYHLNSYIVKDSPDYRNVKFPEHKDQLHLNKYGHMEVACGIVRWMQEKYVRK